MTTSKLLGTSLIGGERGSRGKETFKAGNPASGEELDPPFYAASPEEVDQAAARAEEAFAVFGRTSGKVRASLLRRIADEIEALGDGLVERASLETGLPAARIQGERARTCNQLRLFASVAEEGSWVDARIDHAQADRKPLPKPDVRLIHRPIGPVVVFGASNFPLAFSAAGGDTASALAVGCPVIVKAHHSHSGTNELVALAVSRALKAENLPGGVYSLLFGSGRDVGLALVRHPIVRAVGFTGSFQGGTALHKEAQNRKDPIPVFAEMGSVNPVFFLDGALAERSDELAKGMHGSVTLGIGQFCTNPGLAILREGPSAERFLEKLKKQLEATDAGVMLNTGICRAYRKGVLDRATRSGVSGELVPGDENKEGAWGRPALFSVNAEDFIADPELHEEIFGPSTQAVLCEDADQMLEVARVLQGQLTATVHGVDADLEKAGDLLAVLERKAGRLIVNGFPTGVEVCHSMMHGGPFPATTDVRFTSVGTTALRRFVRPLAFQDFPDNLLPEELKENNPLGIQRLVDGKYSR